MSIDDVKPEEWDNLKAHYAEMAESVSPDYVNHPPHYTGTIECIDALESLLSKEEFIGWLRGNAMKYLWRLRSKDNPQQDAEKCLFFLKRLIKTFK